MVFKSHTNELHAEAIRDVCLIGNAQVCSDLPKLRYLCGAGVAGPVVLGGKVGECGTCTWNMLSSLHVRSCDMNDWSMRVLHVFL